MSAILFLLGDIEHASGLMFCRHGKASLLEAKGRALTYRRCANALLDMGLGHVLLGEVVVHHLVVGMLVLLTGHLLETAHDR